MNHEFGVARQNDKFGFLIYPAGFVTEELVYGHYVYHFEII